MSYNEDENDFTYTVYYETEGSSAVDGIYYNHNDQYAVVDWNDELYRYDNVPHSVVTDVVRSDSVGAATAAKIKQVYGPGEYLGNYSDLDFEPTLINSGVASGTPKDLNTVPAATNIFGAYAAAAPTDLTVATDNIIFNVTPFAGGDFSANNAETKEFSLATPQPVFDESVSGAPLATGDTKEFSLKTPELKVAEVTPGTLVSDIEQSVRDSVKGIRVHFTIDGVDGKRKYDAKANDVVGAVEELHAFVSRLGLRGNVTKVVVKFD